MSKPRGLYTPVYASLPRHEKVQAAADALKCDRHKLVGHLVSMWTWCLDGYTSGKALSASSIALGADWPARKAQPFADALADAGLLDRVDGGYAVHEWDEYGGKVARIQQADRERHSTEVPQSFPRTSPLDETRREETKEEDRKEISPDLPIPDLTPTPIQNRLPAQGGVLSPAERQRWSRRISGRA